MVWPNGRKYVGPWQNDQCHGIGVFIEPGVGKRQGEWQNGKRIKWISGTIKMGGESNLNNRGIANGRTLHH